MTADLPITPAVDSPLLPRITLGIVLIAAVVAFNAPAGPIVVTAAVVIAYGTGFLAFLGARQSPYRPLVVLMAIGMVVSGTGDLVLAVMVHTGGDLPAVSVADIFWLGAYVAAGAALLRLPDGGLDRDGAVDVAVIFVVAMVTQWELAVNDIVTDSSIPVLTRFVTFLYPTFDAAMFALVVRAAVNGRLRGRFALLVGAGVAAWLAADFGYVVLDIGDRDSPILVTGYMFSAVFFAASAWVSHDPAPPLRARGGAGRRRFRRSGIAIALLPLLVPATIALIQELDGDVRNPLLLYGTALVLLALAYTRGAQILQDEADAWEALRSQERFAQAAALNSSDAHALLDRNGCLLSEAPLLAGLIGHDGAPTRGRFVFDLIAPEDHDDSRAVFDRCLTVPGQAFETEFRVSHSEGHQMWLGARLTNLLDDPDVGGVMVNIHDISARRRAEEELSHQAFHDGLTELANRALFGDRVNHALDRNRRSGVPPVVIYLDLDGFKNVNDSLGHNAGDLLLREVADRLVGSVRTGDTVARLGGDEFAILIDQGDDPLAEAKAVAERILAALARPIDVDGHSVTVAASLGIAVSDADSTATSLLRDADVAMYRAKTAGKARWVIHDSDMRSAAIERMRLESDLISALSEGQLRLVYQPVIDLGSDRIVSFEALVRWVHPTLGVISPDRFIPIAEETGLIVPIGRWVLREATETLARWLRAHPHHAGLSMAVNVSGRQLASVDLVRDVADAIITAGIAPQALVIEITETALIQDPTVAAERLGALSALGVRLAIDDFGTGYSSLSYLRQFPIDILKIDRSFINSITDTAEVPAIVRGLLDLGRTLELETVAEGVELAVQRDHLRNQNCDLAQGYFFSRPVDSEVAELMLDDRSSYAVAI